jgi:hypothetical protein
MPTTADLQRDGAEGEDRRHPEADEDALVVVACEPQGDGEDERGGRGREDRSRRAQAKRMSVDD